jgi:hypothetical protein
MVSETYVEQRLQRMRTWMELRGLKPITVSVFPMPAGHRPDRCPTDATHDRRHRFPRARRDLLARIRHGQRTAPASSISPPNTMAQPRLSPRRACSLRLALPRRPRRRLLILP